MAPYLTSEKLFDATLPRSWETIVKGIEAFFNWQTKNSTKTSMDVHHLSQEKCIELNRMHNDLVLHSKTLLEPDTVADITERDVHLIFARAVLLLTHFKQCVMGDDPILNTMGSRTLTMYEADFFQSPENIKKVHDQLITVLSLSNNDLKEVEETIKIDLKSVWHKQKLVRAIRDEFSLWPDKTDLRSGIERFFKTLFPAVPIGTDVELLVTSNLIFVGVPFEGNEIKSTKNKFSEKDQILIREFLNRLNNFAIEQFANFPAFGFVTGSGVDEKCLESISRRSGLSRTEIIREFGTLITILPLSQMDKYLVHDVWGHGWQAGMLHFEDVYRTLVSRCREI